MSRENSKNLVTTEQPTRHELSDLGRKIFLDRYALKTKDMPEEGMTVIHRQDGGIGIGIVVNVYEQDSQVVLDLGDENTIKCAIKDVEIPLEIEPSLMIKRVVSAMADIENCDKKEEWRENFFWLLDDWQFVPAGRILSSAGRSKLRTAYNCFVLPSPRDCREDIVKTLGRCIDIMACGGGVGLNISTLRPRNAYVISVNGRSSGPVSWSELYSQAVLLVEQGGSRRGACILVLDDWHPDILEFINAKRKAGVLEGVNLSVAISDRFMKAVLEDQDWDLVFPDTTHPRYDDIWDGDIEAWAASRPIIHYKTVKARHIWQALVESAWRSAEPGVLFLDRYNEKSNSWYLSKIRATNPCGEQGLPDWGVCNLGSLNLPKFIDNQEIAWERLRLAVWYAVRFMDNVVDSAYCVFDEVTILQKSQRRIGLGTMGLGELLIRLKIRYGSPECLEFLDKLYGFIAQEAYLASAEYALEKGSFPSLDIEKYMDSGYMKAMPEEIRAVVKEKGIRNITVLSQAPTGTIATMVGTSTGIEPYFSWEFRTKNRLGIQKVETAVHAEWVISHPGSPLPDYFVTAQELSPEEHVRVQAMIQRWVDSAISKTCNMHAGATMNQVMSVYMLLYELGCKGGTIYVDGSRMGQPLSAIDKEVPGLSETLEVRPVKLFGRTYRKKTPVGTAYITINANESAKQAPFEVFINVGKAGSDVAADAEALGRLISLILRLPGPSSAYERAQDIVGQLRGIGSGRAQGFGKQRVMSLADAVAQALAEHVGFNATSQLPGLPDVDEDTHLPLPLKTGDLCPECGQATFVFEEGCKKCYGCGYSEC